MQYNKDTNICKVMRPAGKRYKAADTSGKVLADLNRGL